MKANKEILRLSIPAIVSNITVPLLGLCDTAISGHLGSELYLAAIAVGANMLNVIFWLFGFLRMGTTGLTATAYGRDDDDELKRVFTRSLLLGFGIGVLLLAASVPILKFMMIVIEPEPEVEALVAEYFKICIWEAPSLLGTMAISGWFVGMQTTFWPMVISISVNIINIVVSCVLVFGLHMGFEGVACGTVTANWIGFAIALFAAWRFREGKGLWCRKSEIFHGLGRFFTVNVNLFFRSFCLIAVTLGVTAAGARLGALTLAVNAVMMQFFTFFSFFMDGFAFSAEALTGKAHGAGDLPQTRMWVRHLLLWTLGVAALFSLCYGVGTGAVTDLLTDDATVREGVRGMWLWIMLIPIVSAWAFIYDGFYIGITDTGKMLLATFLASLTFFAVAFLKFCDGGLTISVGTNMHLWSAFLSYLLIRGVVLALLWPHELRKVFVK